MTDDKDATIARLTAELEKACIDRDFFQSEVKLRNRIPATCDTTANLLRRAERAEAKLAEAAAAGTFAQGIEAAASFVDGCDPYERIEGIAELIRDLSPAQQADRNDNPPLNAAELADFREKNPLDWQAKVALAAWVNVRPDQLPAAMQAHNCPATMEAWARVAKALTRQTAPVRELATEKMVDAAFKALPPDAHGTIGTGEMYRVIEAALAQK